MSTTFEYLTMIFNPLGEHASGNSYRMLMDDLNAMGKEGWRLVQMPPVSNGFVLIMERANFNEKL